MENKCRTCKHFEMLDAKGAGTCHRNPPQILMIPQQTLQGMQLVPAGVQSSSRADGWCGEWAEKPVSFAGTN